MAWRFRCVNYCLLGMEKLFIKDQCIILGRRFLWSSKKESLPFTWCYDSLQPLHWSLWVATLLWGKIKEMSTTSLCRNKRWQLAAKLRSSVLRPQSPEKILFKRINIRKRNNKQPYLSEGRSSAGKYDRTGLEVLGIKLLQAFFFYFVFLMN